MSRKGWCGEKREEDKTEVSRVTRTLMERERVRVSVGPIEMVAHQHKRCRALSSSPFNSESLTS